MSVKGGPGIFQHQQQQGESFKALFNNFNVYTGVFSEHWSSYAPGCSVFYTTVDASGSHCDSFFVLDVPQRFYWWQKKALWWLSIIFHRDWDGTHFFFILFTTANDKRYLTLYKLVISITIIVIIINKWYATISGVADENIDDAGSLHK